MSRLGRLGMCLLAACSGDDGPPSRDAALAMPEAIAVSTTCTLPTAVATTQTLDVSYGADAALTMDIARPTAPGARPLVVLIHGGGWSAGSKEDFRELLLGLAGQGYVAASLNYRLAAAPNFTFPTQVQDVRCALRTLRTRASTYGIDANHVVAIGGSAGAHLAAMLGVAADAAGLDGTCAATDTNVKVDGVVSLAGPMDLRTITDYPAATQPILVNFFDGEPTSDPAEATLASPITHVTSAAPPFLFFHGTIDDVVPFDQSVTMQQALWAANVPATLVSGVYGHGGAGLADTTTSLCTLAAFIAEYAR